MPSFIQELTEKLGKDRTVVTIGNFDGQHIAHQRIFSMVKNKAEETGRKSLAMTFLPHPAYVLGGGADYELITSYDERRTNILSSGIDIVAEYPFTKEFSSTEPEDFLRMLAGDIRCSELFIGEDYHFGRNRSGCMRDYVTFALSLGINVHFVPVVHKDGERVSSTTIRKLIADGRFGKAERFLGRPYSIGCQAGFVAKTYKEADSTSFRISVPREKLLPPEGDYAAAVVIGGVKVPCRLTVAGSGGAKTVECVLPLDTSIATSRKTREICLQ